MFYQLDKVLLESKLGSEKVLGIYSLLESLLRGSIMASEFNRRYPELALEEHNWSSIPVARNSRSYLIACEGHPFDRMVYTEYRQGGSVDVDNTFLGTYGSFNDPNELVLRYVRAELFKN